jgi:vacuolar-type H+-ATPase subunit B/Vma2
MKKIGLFFEKFNSKALIEIKKREVVCNVLKKMTGADIPLENVSFINKTLKIKGSSALKNQILIKKKTIIDLIYKEIPNLKIDDIQ